MLRAVIATIVCCYAIKVECKSAGKKVIALTQIADSFVYLNRREMLISVKEPCITLADLSHCGGIPTPRPSEQVFLIKLSDAQHMKKNNLQLL